MCKEKALCLVIPPSFPITSFWVPLAGHNSDFPTNVQSWTELISLLLGLPNTLIFGWEFYSILFSRFSLEKAYTFVYICFFYFRGFRICISFWMWVFQNLNLLFLRQTLCRLGWPQAWAVLLSLLLRLWDSKCYPPCLLYGIIYICLMNW